MTETGRERHRDLDRLLTFVDAVVAIAITLLVLPLAELPGELGEGSTRDLLSDHKPEIGAFLLSFAVISRLWFAQHRIVSGLVLSERRFERLLVLWTATIVFLPFPTALVAEAPNSDATAKVLYVGTMALSALLLGLIALVIRSRPELWDGPGRPDPAPTLTTAAMFVVALAISLAFPEASYFPLLLLLVSDRVVHLWRRAGTAAGARG